MEPDGSRLCYRCELTMANFKIMEQAIMQKYPLNANPAMLGKGQSASASLLTAESQKPVSTKRESYAQTSQQPSSKLLKIEKKKFVLNEHVLYFDRDSQRMEKGIIAKSEPPHSYLVINPDKNRSYRVNEGCITKTQDN